MVPAASLVSITLILVVLAVFVRKLYDKAGALSRQLNELVEQLSAEHAEHLRHTEAVLGSIQKTESQAARFREEGQLSLNELAVEFRNQTIDVRDLVRAYPDRLCAQSDQQLKDSVDVLSTRVREAISQLRDFSARVDSSAGAVSDLSAKVADLSTRTDKGSYALDNLATQVAAVRVQSTESADLLEIMSHSPAHNLPIDQNTLRKKTEGEMVSLAREVATLRPLVPYPKWRFDADWSNPDLAFQLRQSIWQYFNDRRSETPVVIGWHYGTRLALYMGNDLSRQIYVAGCIDPNEFAFLDRFLQPGMTFLDAGANEGIYSIFAAARVGAEGTVWAFEPSQRELERLQTNIVLNDFNMPTFPVALADTNGQAELTVAGYGHEGQNTLGAFVYDIESSGKERIDLARLDDLIAKNPPSRIDLIKVDVEGAEQRLFLGAAETLRRYRPILLFEVSESALRNQGSSREDLVDFLRTHEYTCYCFDRNSGVPTAAALGSYSDNMIGAPVGTGLPEAVFRHWPDTSDERAQFRQAGSSAKIRVPRAPKLNSVHTRF